MPQTQASMAGMHLSTSAVHQTPLCTLLDAGALRAVRRKLMVLFAPENRAELQFGVRRHG